MKAKSFFIALIATALSVAGIVPAKAQKTQTLSSPDGRLKVNVHISGVLSYDVYAGNKLLMEGNTLSMELEDKLIGLNARLSRVTRKSVSETIHPVVSYKSSEVENRYNQMLLRFKDGYSVEFRAFDDGVAYRFITNYPGEVEVRNEEIGVHFPEACLLTISQTDRFKTAYEEPYSHVESTDWTPSGNMAYYPILARFGDGCNILFSESALHDYPAAFFKGTDNNGFTSVFPKYPVEFHQTPNRDRSVVIDREGDFIARTSGSRSFPWRYFVITREDADLLTTTMTCRLAEKSAIEDISWIKPGQASWEWWNGAVPYGPDVNFKAGCNLETYKYFIDFASHYGIEYIVMDEGWAADTRDPFTPNPDVDLFELLRYGKEKNVGIILWLTWLSVENNPEVFAKFEEWGVAGIKIDFMDRSDQWMVNFYERTIAEAARHHLFVDFHGAFKPAGLEYKYPNLLSYEGVLGMEQMGRCTPSNSIYLPFLRNVTGPMEYTPGAMLSMQPEVYVSRRPNSASIGTRAYQLALFVVFESGIQMLADNPTLYYKNDECTRFIADVPVVWDETRPLSAKIGDHVVVAKRSGDKWYIGGMTAEREEPLTLEIPLDFLGHGTFEITAFEDGVNSDVQAMDYRKTTSTVTGADKLTVSMVRNGGFAAVIAPVR